MSVGDWLGFWGFILGLGVIEWCLSVGDRQVTQRPPPDTECPDVRTGHAG